MPLPARQAVQRWTRRTRQRCAASAVLGSVLIASCATAPETATRSETDSVAIPAEEAILATLRPSHPRLFLGEGGFEALERRIAADATLREWYASIRASADAVLDEPPSTYQLPDGLRLLGTSRRVQDRVYALALAYRIEGDRRYLERAWEELRAAAAFPDWNPQHFLDVAEMTHAFAVAYDWLYDAWSPEQRSLLRQAIIEKGLLPAQDLYREGRGFVTRTNNWNHVCNGGMILGSLAIAGDDTTGIARHTLHQALTSMDESGAMDQFAPDGAWDEGPGYWGYTARYTAYALAATESALGTTFGFESKPGFSEAGFFPLYTASPAGKSFNFADGGDSAAGGAAMYWLARLFDRPVFTWYERRRNEDQGVHALLWYTPAARSPERASLPLDRYFRHAEVVTMRSAWNAPDATWVGFKAGHPSDPHAHMDVGTFVLDANGVRWAGDFGKENYNLPHFWDYERVRWTYYRLRAEGHNTLILDPGEGPEQDPSVRSKIVAHRSAPDAAMAIADLTPSYASRVQEYQRGIALVNDREWVLLQDEVKDAGSVPAWWFMHTRADIEVQHDSATAVLSSDGQRLWVRILSPAGAGFSVRDAVPLPGSPNPPGQESNEGWRKLTIRLDEVDDLRLTVLFVPLAPGDVPPSALPGVEPLGARWPSFQVRP